MADQKQKKFARKGHNNNKKFPAGVRKTNKNVGVSKETFSFSLPKLVAGTLVPHSAISWRESTTDDPVLALLQYALLCAYIDAPDDFNYHVIGYKLHLHRLQKFFQKQKVVVKGVSDPVDADLVIGGESEIQAVQVSAYDFEIAGERHRKTFSVPAGSDIKLLAANGSAVFRLTGVNQPTTTFSTHFDLRWAGRLLAEATKADQKAEESESSSSNSDPPSNSPNSPPPSLPPPPPPPPPQNPPPALPPQVPNPVAPNLAQFNINTTVFTLWDVLRVIWALLWFVITNFYQILTSWNLPVMPTNYFVDANGNPDLGAYNRYVAALLSEDYQIADILRSFSQQPRRGPDLFQTICSDLQLAPAMRRHMENTAWWIEVDTWLRSHVYCYLYKFFFFVMTTLLLPKFTPLLRLFMLLSKSIFLFIAKSFWANLRWAFATVYLAPASWIDIQKEWMDHQSVPGFFQPQMTWWESFLEYLDSDSIDNWQYSWLDSSPDPYSNGRAFYGPPDCVQFNKFLLLQIFLYYAVLIPLIEEAVKSLVTYWWFVMNDHLGGKQWADYKRKFSDNAWYGLKMWVGLYFIYLEWLFYGSVGSNAILHFALASRSFPVAFLIHALHNAFVWFHMYVNHLYISSSYSWACYNWLDDNDSLYYFSTFLRYGSLPLWLTFGVLCVLGVLWVVKNFRQRGTILEVGFKEYFLLPKVVSVHMLPVCVGDRPANLAPGNFVRQATGDHKQRYQGYYSCGLMLKCAAPFSFASCHHNANAAGVSRMAGAQKRYANVSDQAQVANFWDRLVAKRPLQGTIHQIEGEITTGIWFKRFTLKQIEALKQEYKRGNRNLKFDMFVKKEKSVRMNPYFEHIQKYTAVVITEHPIQRLLDPGNEKFDPRGISVPRADVRVHFGPSSHRLQNKLKESYGDHILFASGLTRRAFSKWYERALYTHRVSYCNVGDDLMQITGGDFPTIESLDISRFDMHVCAAALRFNARCYHEWGWTQEAAYSLATVNKVYSIRPGSHGGKGLIRVKGTQASGKWDTLGGNSMIVIRLIEYAEEFNLPLRYVLALGGFVPTGGACPPNVLEMDFLQNLPYPSRDDGIRFGPKIGRILARSFWSEVPLAEDKHLNYCYGVMLGLANDIMHIPILNDLFIRLSSLNLRPWFPKRREIKSLIVSEKPATEDPSTLALLADRYSVPLEELRRYRTYISVWQPGQWLDLGFERLVYAIVEKDCF